VPAAEVHHPGAEGAVGIVEDGLAGHGGLLRRGLLIIPEWPGLRASDGRSRGGSGAPALLQSVLSRRAGAPLPPLRFAVSRRLRFYVGSTWSCMPSAPTMRTRVPAGRSGPSTVQ